MNRVMIAVKSSQLELILILGKSRTSPKISSTIKNSRIRVPQSTTLRALSTPKPRNYLAKAMPQNTSL